MVGQGEDTFMENIITNKLILAGEVISDLSFWHDSHGEKFYTFNLRVSRLSEANDVLPVLISEKIMDGIKKGELVSIEGQVRSYNRYTPDGRRLLTFAFVQDVALITSEELGKLEQTNYVELTCQISNIRGLRRTPHGREVCDMHVSVTRAFNKSDFVPVITWGRNAKFCNKLEVGTEVHLVGRLQARPYTKKGSKDVRTAYEVSVSRIETTKQPVAI